MPQKYLRKYGVQATLDFTLYETDGVDFKIDAVHASGDTVIMKDEGAEANTANGFTDEGQGYSLVLTATEMQAARIVVYIVDQGTKAWLDDYLVVETYGNASAQHAVDLGDSVRAGLTALPNAAADAAGGLPISDAGGLDMDAILSRIGTPSDLGGGATLADNLSDIEGQTDDIGAAGAGLTAVPWNAAWDAEVQSEVQDAIEANHLDHLLAADYDPASKPGVATALLNELVENDVGVSRFTANALEEAPTGGSAPTVEEIRAEIDSNSTQLAAIVADTNELQTDDVPGLIAALNNITAQNVTDDLLAEVIESSKTFKTMILDMWAVTVGNALANDADNPTSIIYDSPDDTVQRTHTLTSTSRSQS